MTKVATLSGRSELNRSLYLVVGFFGRHEMSDKNRQFYLARTQ